MRLSYLGFDGQVELPLSGVVVEGFPEDEDGLLTSGGLDRELPVVVAADEAVAHLGVGRVRLVAIQSLNSAKDGQTCSEIINF